MRSGILVMGPPTIVGFGVRICWPCLGNQVGEGAIAARYAEFGAYGCALRPNHLIRVLGYVMPALQSGGLGNSIPSYSDLYLRVYGCGSSGSDSGSSEG